MFNFIFISKVEKFDQEQLNNYIVNTPYIVKNSYLKTITKLVMIRQLSLQIMILYCLKM